MEIQNEYERGYEDGKNAGCLDELLSDMVAPIAAVLNPEYTAGWEDGKQGK